MTRDDDARDAQAHLVELRLRRALAARAEQVTPALLAEHRPGLDALADTPEWLRGSNRSSRWSRHLPAIAAAAAVVALVAAGSRLWWPFAGAGSTDAGHQLTTSSAAGGADGADGAGAGPGGLGVVGGAPIPDAVGSSAAPGPTPPAATTAAPATDPVRPHPASPSHVTTGIPAFSVSVGALATCTVTEIAAALLPDTPSRGHTRRGGAGQRGLTVTLTNTASHACSLRGYPGVAVYDANGDPVSAPTSKRGSTAYAADPGPAAVTLAPGGAAYVDLSFPEPTSAAPSITAADLGVILPNQRDQLRIPYDAQLDADVEVITTVITSTPLPLAG
jgi:Protein of unknown function (DUF4232)